MAVLQGKNRKRFSRVRNYLDFLKIDKKLLAVCILSLLAPITLHVIYFYYGFVTLIRENESQQAQANVDRIENYLNDILGRAADIADRIYVNPRIQQIVAAEYGSLLEIYNAYAAVDFFEDYLRSSKEISGIRLYVENQTMVDNSYFIVRDAELARENWYINAKSLEGRMFWTYRRDSILRSECVSLVREVRDAITGRHVGVLCVNLEMGYLERLCAAELHDTFISLNGEIISLANHDRNAFSAAGRWIITNSFVPRQALNSVFDITCIISQRALVAPVYSMLYKSLVIVIVSLAVSLFLILQIVNVAYIQKLQKEQLFSRQKEMQLKILSNQINPHFLYNTLETIRMMALGKKEKEIAGTIKLLSRILRQSLSAAERAVPVETELDLVRDYLAIQKLRFGSRMNYSIEINSGPDTVPGRCLILPFLIQPLVENALVHGLEPKPGGGNIRIVIQTTGAMLTVDVIDDGMGMTSGQLEQIRGNLARGGENPDGRIGLANVNRRIKLYYGELYGLAVSGGVETGTRIQMVLPLTTIPRLPAGNETGDIC
jgi:two-component system sensor histidine kinase YesM